MSFSRDVRGCDLRCAQLSYDARRAPVLPGILQAITVKQQRLHASVRKNYAICGSAIDLHRVACATASKKSTFAAPRATVARRGGYHRCRENRARDAVRCRGTPGVHILSVRSYSANRCASGSRSRRAATSRNEIRLALARTPRPYRASRSRRLASSPNERSLETHQPYRAQAPTAMVT